MTIGEILGLLPRKDRRTIERILGKPGDVLKAARELKPILAKNAEVLTRNGLLPDYAAYALPFYAWNVGGDIYEFIRGLEAQVKQQTEELKALERRVDTLQQMVNTDPTKN